MTTLFHKLIHRLSTDPEFRHAFQTQAGGLSATDTAGLSAEDLEVLQELRLVLRAKTEKLLVVPDWDGRAELASMPV